MLFVVLYYMNPRRCIYTNNQANSKDTIVPKRDEDSVHNWANRAPVSNDYKKNKQNRLPTDLEMEANRLFYMLELARLDVSYLTARLKEVQEQITGKKQEEVEKAYHIKELTETFEEDVKESLEDKKTKVWD